MRNRAESIATVTGARAWIVQHPLLAFFVVAYSITYQACYPLEKIGSNLDEVPQKIFLGTLS